MYIGMIDIVVAYILSIQIIFDYLLVVAGH
jgi:hypothetical protein